MLKLTILKKYILKTIIYLLFYFVPIFDDLMTQICLTIFFANCESIFFKLERKEEEEEEEEDE
jgi:uncharacterized protein involved in cysteine biosynthesis